ncbi:MAG: thermonuclease family protein [Pseudomonadales bacterium]|nr:thermonuclease family protein [Pseudomonadales bacterium]
MAYRIIKGTVSIDGKEPDGDTLSFKISDQNDWLWPGAQDGRFPRFNAKYQANIRFEAIDALEIHYRIQDVYSQPNVKQPLELAVKARDRLLTLCGFDLSNISETGGFRIVDPDQQEMPVTLAYNGIDPFGRIIGFVFTDDLHFEVNDRNPTVNLYPEHIERSINAKLLREGLVYPTYYGGLYPSLREYLTTLVKDARREQLGIWQYHQSEIVLPLKPTLLDIETIVMMPKLFRRLVTHIAKNGSTKQFRNSLRQSKDMVVDTREVRLSNFSSFVRYGYGVVEDQIRIWMTHQPEELVFVGG